jgi:AcrR family transcriptional regulator
MNVTEDRRISRTKEAIRQALVSLIQEKGVDALSVKDITTRANINRGTFYLHYKDKFDLLDQTLNEITHDLEKITWEMNALSSDKLLNTTMLSAASVRLFKYFDANAPLMKVLLSIKGTNSLQNAIKDIMWRNIFEQDKTTHIKKENLLVPEEYLISYIISAHIGVIQEWLEKKFRETPEEMADILINLSFRGPLYAIGLKP